MKNTILIVGISFLVVGCGRGRPSEKSPLAIDRGMMRQPKYKAYSENDFFADKSAMRVPVAGTVARGQLHEDEIYYTGKDPKGSFIKTTPVSITYQLLKRGQERFDIYCSPCHSRLGDGKGIVVTRGYLPPPNFHTDRIRQLPDGQIFDVITHGIRNMPSYGPQIPVPDRWAIVAYIRTLQKSQNAALGDIPAELRQSVH